MATQFEPVMAMIAAPLYSRIDMVMLCLMPFIMKGC
jgi:hypothetical protein